MESVLCNLTLNVNRQQKQLEVAVFLKDKDAKWWDKLTFVKKENYEHCIQEALNYELAKDDKTWIGFVAYLIPRSDFRKFSHDLKISELNVVGKHLTGAKASYKNGGYVCEAIVMM
ncbi:MAG: hypothetical protein IKF52_05805 [Clostridia bacterium]|nr:hypothetical protein [Clostridia bacterium]